MTPAATAQAKPSPADWLVRITGFGLVWWIITDADLGSWLIGIPAVLLASWASLALAPNAADRPRLRLARVPEFVAFFLYESLRGGLDVAWRTLQPRLAVAPGFAEFDSGLPASAPRLLMVNCVSLLPGTLSADLDGTRIRIHCLDSSADFVAELHDLERRIADLYGINRSEVSA